jgi:YHS domain-containing protein
MKTMKTQWPIALVLLVLFTVGVFLPAGCKKKSEPTIPEATKEVISEAIEQKICPVMEGPINKEIYTEYKDKKVYFCCPGCKEQFEKEPEKYVEKLPQFSR